MSDATALTKAREMGLAAYTAASNPFTQDAQKEGVTDGFWLRMNGQTGVWLCNLPQQPELAPGTELVMDIFRSEKVWLGFDNKNKLFTGPKVSVISGQNLPEPPPTANVEWTKHYRIPVATTDGGRQLLMTCKANNPYREVLKLVKRYGELFMKFVDPTGKPVPPFPHAYKLPVVKIGSVSYDMVGKVKKVVPNKDTGVDEVVEVDQALKPWREVFTITDDDKDWISQKEMNEILAEAAPVPAAAGASAEAESPQIAASQNAADYVDTTPKPETKAIEAEIIPPGVKAPTAEVSSFRRNRAGQTGVRTA